MSLKQGQSTQIFIDNEIATSISLNLLFYGKIKHFNVKLFDLKEVQENSIVNLVYCKTEDQDVHIFIKLFSLSKFEFLKEKFGIRSLQDNEKF